MADLYFLNKNRELVGIIDTAKSIQWLERYRTIGTFEVYVPVTDDVLNIVNQSYFIARTDSKYVGVIEHVENADDIDDGNFLIIQGQMSESIIGRRIIRNISYFTNETLFNICDSLLQKNILNPVLQEGETISPRKIDCLNTTVINKLTYNPRLETQASFENNLLEFITDLLSEYDSSIRLELNENGKFDVVLYSGTDRSYNQNTNAYVVFSKEFDNLISSNYIFNSTKESNALYVGGENNDLASEGRYVDKYELPVGSGVVGDLDRKEAFINASDLKQSWEEEKADGTKEEHSLTTEQYRKLLVARGKENVAEPSEELAASVDINMYVYNKDYFLGDIVTIYNETFGMSTNRRLIGMDIIDDENGRTLEPTFEEGLSEITNVGYILSEASEIMTTEDGANLVVENYGIATASLAIASDNTTNEETNSGATYNGNVKISELYEVTSDEVQEGCCLPIVTSGETKKITYGILKEKLSNEIGGGTEVEALTTQEIDALLV